MAEETPWFKKREPYQQCYVEVEGTQYTGAWRGV